MEVEVYPKECEGPRGPFFTSPLRAPREESRDVNENLAGRALRLLKPNLHVNYKTPKHSRTHAFVSFLLARASVKLTDCPEPKTCY